MVTTPTLLNITPFDTKKGTTVYFAYTGSGLTSRNNLRIIEKETQLAVYDFEYTTYEKSHPIPPNILQNGKIYSAQIRVKFSDGTYSNYSALIDFYTLATPIIDISNIDGLGYVYNTDITFTATYSQDNGEIIKLYRFTLYDDNEEIVRRFPFRTPDISYPELMMETVTGLEKGIGYFIECSVETEKGFVYSTREKFICLYTVPSINGLINVEEDSNQGFVKVTANVKDVLGTSIYAGYDIDGDGVNDNTLYAPPQIKNPNEYEYENNEWVLVPDDNPIVFRKLGMNRASDYIIKIWFKSVPNDKMFLELSSKYEIGTKLKFYKRSNRIVVEKQNGSVYSHHTSNVISMVNNIEYMLYVRVIEHRLDLKVISV